MTRTKASCLWKKITVWKTNGQKIKKMRRIFPLWVINVSSKSPACWNSYHKVWPSSRLTSSATSVFQREDDQWKEVMRTWLQSKIHLLLYESVVGLWGNVGRLWLVEAPQRGALTPARVKWKVSLCKMKDDHDHDNNNRQLVALLSHSVLAFNKGQVPFLHSHT